MTRVPLTHGTGMMAAVRSPLGAAAQHEPSLVDRCPSIPDRRHQTMTVCDGRRLGFAEFGAPAGTPVFFFHGSASSRLERPPGEGMLCDLGVRLITADRPGNGLSDLQPGRRLLDWPGDVGALAGHLGIDRFYVAGCSAGGPHALACAYALPGRVCAGAAISSVAPMGRPGAFCGLPLPNRVLAMSSRWAPWLARLIRRSTHGMVARNAGEASKRMMASLPASDKRVLYAPENLAIMIESVREGQRPGWQGVAQDDALVNGDWGFDVGDISVRVDIWHGTQDANVPAHAGEYLHDHIPNSRATFLPGEGHFFLFNEWRRVLSALVHGGTTL